MEFVGVGDLHFDSSVAQHLKTTQLHDLIVQEIQSVFKYARRNGVKTAVFYGDIAHTATLTPESWMAFLRLLKHNTDMRLIVMTGNHDVTDSGRHSLRELQEVADSWMPHVKVLSQPKCIRIDGELLNVLPWPHVTTRADACNVLHVEVKGSKFDSGRDTKSKTVIDPEHFCVAGHLHTSQVVGNVHFSGTLYQTNFAEKLPKFFHHVRYGDGVQEARLIPHKPALTLHNVIIKSRKDLDTIPDDSMSLCKVFVKDGVDIDPDELAKRPNVISRLHSFKNKEELEVLINEDLFIGEDNAAIDFNYREVFVDWLTESKADKAAGQMALSLLDSLIERKVTHGQGED